MWGLQPAQAVTARNPVNGVWETGCDPFTRRATTGLHRCAAKPRQRGSEKTNWSAQQASIPIADHGASFGQNTAKPSTFSLIRYSDLPAVTYRSLRSLPPKTQLVGVSGTGMNASCFPSGLKT